MLEPVLHLELYLVGIRHPCNHVLGSIDADPEATTFRRIQEGNDLLLQGVVQFPLVLGVLRLGESRHCSPAICPVSIRVERSPSAIGRRAASGFLR